MLNVWGVGKVMRNEDVVFNPEALIPPRPTISNLEWMSGTQYMTPSQISVLVGGPDRPPSKRMMEQMRAEDVARSQRPGQPAVSRSHGEPETWTEYMQRQINERTEMLGLAGDRMDRLEDNSSSWSDEVNKFVSQQKRSLALGGKCAVI